MEIAMRFFFDFDSNLVLFDTNFAMTKYLFSFLTQIIKIDINSIYILTKISSRTSRINVKTFSNPFSMFLHWFLVFLNPFFLNQFSCNYILLSIQFHLFFLNQFSCKSSTFESRTVFIKIYRINIDFNNFGQKWDIWERRKICVKKQLCGGNCIYNLFRKTNRIAFKMRI